MSVNNISGGCEPIYAIVAYTDLNGNNSFRLGQSGQFTCMMQRTFDKFKILTF